MQAAHSKRLLRVEVCSCPASTLRQNTGRQEAATGETAAPETAPPVPFNQIQFDGGSPRNPIWEYFRDHKEGPLVHKWCGVFCASVTQQIGVRLRLLQGAASLTCRRCCKWHAYVIHLVRR